MFIQKWGIVSMVLYVNKIFVLLIVSFFSGTNAYGYCSTPMAPEPPGVYAKPTKPMVAVVDPLA